MATGQALLDYCEVLDRELQLQSGESDVVAGLRALNAAQDYFESVIALHPNILGSDIGTVTTANGTESTAFPTGLIRIDRMQFIDPGTSRPAWDLDRVWETGGHSGSDTWPVFDFSGSAGGRPVRYWTNGSNIYWDPLPNATHTVRYYGLTVSGDITAAATFAYPDIAMLPVASFAVKLLNTGKADDTQNLSSLAREVFEPTILTLKRFNRDRPVGYSYRYTHDA